MISPPEKLPASSGGHLMMSHPSIALRRVLRALALTAFALAVSAPAFAHTDVWLIIENNVTEITEGESFRYKVRRGSSSGFVTVNMREIADADAQANLDLSGYGNPPVINLTPFDGKLESGWRTISIPDNSEPTTSTTGTNGTLTFSISTSGVDNAYNIIEPHTWTITVHDDEEPSADDIEINFRDTGIGLVEGETVQFVLTADPEPTEPLTINVGLSGGSGFGVMDGTRMVPLAAGATTATLMVETEGNTTNETATSNIRGTLTAELEAGEGYVRGSDRSAFAQVRDDDYELTIEASPLSEVEGAEVELTLHSDTPVADVFEATISISWPEGFGEDRNETETFSFGINDTSVVHTLTLRENDVLNEDATVEVAIVDDSERYVLGAMSSVTLTIEDDDEPTEAIEVSIRPGDSPVVEGGNAVFTLTASRAPLEDLAINVSLSGGDDFGVMDPEPVPLGAGTTTAMLTVPIPADTENQSGNFRTLRATVETGTGYVPVDTSFVSADVEIQDDDYRLTLEEQTASARSEGQEARILLAVDEQRNVLPFDAAVSVTWLQGHEQFGVVDEPRRELQFGALQAEGLVTGRLIRLSIPDNEVVNEDISVRVEILPGEHYELGNPSSVTVTFRDDDVRVSIAAGPAVTEGEAAVFTLSASPAPLSAFRANVSLTGGAGFGLQNLSPTVAFRAGSSTALLMVPNRGDETHEANGVVTAMLQPGLGYSVGATSSAMVTIRDDDVRVSITAASASVAEGEAAVFTLTTSESPLSAFTVPVSWSGGAGFGAEAGARSFEFGVGSTTAVLTVPTRDDATHKRDEAVTAMVGSGPGYTVAAESSTMVTIRDDDVQVSIAAVSASVAEDDPAVFMLTASERPLTAFTVPVSWSGGAAFGVTAGDRSLEFGVGSTTAVLTVPTTGDEIHELDGVVTATLGSGLGYSVGAQASAMATIRDDEITVSIAASSSSVMEGKPAGFILTLSGTPAVAFTVPVSWSGGAGFGVEDGERLFAFGVGSTTATLMLTTQDDLVDEANGVLTATLADGSGYEIGTSASATVTIENDDTSTPDVNADGAVNANDALILYYSYALRSELGNGR